MMRHDESAQVKIMLSSVCRWQIVSSCGIDRSNESTARLC